MIDPTIRRCRADDGDVAELELLEREAREALVGQRGGDRWLVEHPAVGADWLERCAGADVWVAHIDDVVVGYMVAELGEDLIVRIDQVWVTPLAVKSVSVTPCSSMPSLRPVNGGRSGWRANRSPGTDRRRISTSARGSWLD